MPDYCEEDIREFLIESNENLANLDREIVEFEQNPENAKLISSIFRAIHTVKGTCGFFGFDTLGSVAHITENILCQIREGQRKLTPGLSSVLLEAVDKIKALLVKIETEGDEGPDDSGELRARLEKVHQAGTTGESEVAGDAADEDGIALPVETTCVPVANPSGDSQILAVAAKPVPVEQSPAPPVPLMSVMDSVETALVCSIAEETTPEVRSSKEGSGKDTNIAESTIRVDVGLLDKLMNLVGELVLARNQLLQDATTQSTTLQKTLQRLNLITSELQEGVMKTRMQPIGVVWNKLPRVVRDLAAKCGKKVQVEMEGAGTELDRTIIEAIKDPITHIIRNCCDHGIESPEARMAKNKSPEGQLLLRAYHDGGVVNIEISDDGAGIDPEKLKRKAIEKGLIRAEQASQMGDRDVRHLIFMPGFSTAAQVTSISGRGVGMDVVKTNIERIGGSVEVLNRFPHGTTIQIKIPLTLAIIPGLVVALDPHLSEPTKGGNGEQRYVVPQANLLELVRLEGPKDLKLIEDLNGTPIYHHRGKLLPLVYLSRVLGISGSVRKDDVVSVVVLQTENRQIGLVVDRICDTQEIVVKPLGRQLKGLGCYMGATIMGDGRPSLILDVAGLARLAALGGQARQAVQASQPSSAEQSFSQPQMLLLFRAGSFVRLAVPLSLVARLEEISMAKVENAAGRSMLHYRSDILPLVSLSSMLEPNRPDKSLSGETAQVIVFANGTRRIGLVVDQIVDIMNEAITVKRSSSAKGLLGSAAIGGKIVHLLDLHAVVEAAGENWLDSASASSKRHKVLLLDSCATARELMSEYLDISGYDVISATTVSEALPKLRQTPVDLVITAVEMMGGSDFDMLNALRREKHLERIPIVGLVESRDQLQKQPLQEFAFNARLVRSERRELLKSVDELVRCPASAVEVLQ